MKRLTIIGLALLALLTFGAVSAGVASAEPGLLELKTFTMATEEGSKPKLEIATGEFLQCEAVSISSATFTTDTHGSGVLTFTGCKALNLVTAQSLGDAAGTILLQVEFLLCLIAPKTLAWGLFMTPTATVHIEVPATKELLLVKGGVIFENKSGNGPLTSFLFSATGAKGVQSSATSCLNAALTETKKYSFELAKDTTTDKPASAAAIFNLKFSAAVSIMDT